MVQMARRVGCRTIAGGPDPVQYLSEYLDGGVEVVVIGEGEHTVTELMNHLKSNRWQWDWERLRDIPGIAFRVPGAPQAEIHRTPARPLIRPLDSIPWPVRERRDLDGYFQAWRQRHGETAMSMVTSQGVRTIAVGVQQVYGDPSAS